MIEENFAQPCSLVILAPSISMRVGGKGAQGRLLTSPFRVLVALSLAAAMILLASVTGDAAMSASLSSDHARPGDWILLLSDDHNGTWDYHSLSAAGSQAIYLAPVGGDDGTACTGRSVGRLEWRGNRGGVAFRVPNLPLGMYKVLIDVVDASPSCWVIGGLTIGNLAADNQAVAAGWTVNSLARASQQPLPNLLDFGCPSSEHW